ncbi:MULTISPECIES: type VII secretion target [unclassified Mycobacterium]|uniref:type VII secretion target n=1 Tax=unclassified Mycobacterium TaxID=2642494 RepID=UPI00274074AB|nr:MULTISPECIES: type VII secretion target [unclassified Mycobacterium]MDP7703783.1 type VII secretion target [Mycobacterium sp. TY815]MDP7722265.1 type VII secretion target [Mycobacterium sp. TY814]
MRLDSADVRGVADRIDDAAELIGEAVSNHLARLAFDGACAGRAYAVYGDRLRGELDGLAAELSQWSSAAAELAAALRAGADSYAEAESYAAARIA